jgi:predicted acylesterase/phospholipase RssA
MSVWRCAILTILPAVLTLIGCAKSRPFPVADIGAMQRSVPVETAQPFGVTERPSKEPAAIQQASASSHDAPKPKTILALSGGGMYGSYTAGVLNGWTKSGQRPVFDVITGISTGGLIAPLAFAGPDYDAQMKLIYTRVTRRDIFTYRNWISIPFRESIASTTPLRAIVETAMTDELILKIAAEHAKGRRLYVGTTNLDTRRFITWDMGAIASKATTGDRGDMKVTKKLFVDVLIASCSLPGIFPPVPIDVTVDGKTYTELHADGGVVSSVWVPTQVLDAASPDPAKPDKLHQPAELYVILAGKPHPDPSVVDQKTFQVLTVFLNAAQAAQNRRDVSHIYHQSKVANIQFRMTAVAPDFSTPAGGLEFDRTEMNRLYDEGYRIGEKQAWWNSPPERGPGDIDTIRTGTQFKSVVK